MGKTYYVMFGAVTMNVFTKKEFSPIAKQQCHDCEVTTLTNLVRSFVLSCALDRLRWVSIAQ